MQRVRRIEGINLYTAAQTMAISMIFMGKTLLSVSFLCRGGGGQTEPVQLPDKFLT